MKKTFVAILIGVVTLFGMPAVPAYAEDLVYQENVIDKVSDWAQTVGKDKVERDRILAQNKTERQKKHAEKKSAQMKKQAEKKAKEKGKAAETAGKDMKKKMGL